MSETENNTLQIVRGDDEAITVTVTDKDTGDAINITGYTIMFTVRSDVDATDDTTALIKKDVTTHTTPAEGITTINLTHEDTAVAAGNYRYDVQYKDTQNKIKTILIGDIEILQDVTKRT